MDSFSEPYTREGDDISIDKVREKIASLEELHRNNGIPLSGRIIHVCHYLPITATLAKPDLGVLSPPGTPPTKVNDVLQDTESTSSTSVHAQEQQGNAGWSLAPRHGHAAMISGIRSLSHSHEQLIVGWTGDIESSSGDMIPANTVTQAQREEFDEALKTECDPDDARVRYVPVWLDDKVAHGHYDGYCKQSECIVFFIVHS